MEAYQYLEYDLAKWIGCDPSQVVACASGTAALHLGIESLRVPVHKRKKNSNGGRPKEDYNIICPNYTMVACPLAISLSGVKPVFVDCDPNRYNLLPTQVDKMINKSTVAILCVHTYGRLCEMQTIHDLAAKYDLVVIEDMAEAHGCSIHPNTQIACWSFYKNKIVHGEEGGCVYFKSESMAAYARLLRNVGFTPDHDYTHIPRGHNYRMSNAHAKLISESLRSFSQEYSRRQDFVHVYNDHCPEKFKTEWHESPWVYDIRIPNMTGRRQKAIIKVLQSNGIPARYGFKPMTHQEQFRECKSLSNGMSERLSEEIILLPLGQEVTDKMIKRIFELVESTL